MINLLPEQQKAILRQEQQFRLAVILGSLLLVFLACVSLLFLAIRIYVAGSLQSQNILITLQQEQLEQQNSPIAEMRATNATIQNISAFYNNQTLVSETLSHVANTLPQGVLLTSFSYTQSSKTGATSGKISLSGVSPTITELEQLQSNLQAEHRFSNLFSPPSNWANPSAQNINFSFTFEVVQP